jgi:TatD DNase family protein
LLSDYLSGSELQLCVSIFALMQITDTHTHLYADEFSSDRDLLIGEAIAKGVSRFFLPNIDSGSVEALTMLSEKYPEQCFPMMGLHPCSVKENWQEEMDLVEKLLAEKKYVAVGEIGMDLYWDKTFVKEQEEVFKKQVELANHYKLPVSIHSRESFEEIYTILLTDRKQMPCGVFHCFTGNIDQAKRAVDLGFYLGIGGVVTFKNSGLDKVLEQVDLKNIVLETDAPYLSPVPFRGKRNLPEYIIKVAEKVAQVKEISVEEVAEITTMNSKMIFGE